MSENDDQRPVPNPSRFKRMFMEFEVEVIDEVAVRTANFDYTQTEDGDVTSFAESGPDGDAARAVSNVFLDALRARQDEIGIRIISSGTIPRPVSEDGTYTKLELPAMPARNNDGSITEPRE